MIEGGMQRRKAEVDAVRRFFAAASRGDVESSLELAHPHVVFDLTRSEAPWRGVYTGHEEARELWAFISEPWHELAWEMHDLRRVGERIVIETHLRGRGLDSGIEVSGAGGWVVSFADGLVAEAVLYQSFDEALLEGRRRAVADARLYFVCEARPRGRDPRPLLDAALRGGADLIQLRDKELADAELVEAARPFRATADEHGALFTLNDRPDLVAACGADGVHVGQNDIPVADARAAAAPASLVGLSTHSVAEVDAASVATGDGRPDQISVGPVWATPTKEGRAATGLELVEHAASVADIPWFAIGGIDASNVGEVVAAGAERIVVVRAIRDAADPEAAASELRAALETGVGARP